MARTTREQLSAPFLPHLQPGETVIAAAYGVKQPNLFLLLFLIALAVLPGLIAVFLLTKNYLVALTDRRLLVMRTKNASDFEMKELMEYSREELPGLKTKTSTGAIFTHIAIKDETRPFVAKFHRAFCPTNREDAVAIAAAVDVKAIEMIEATQTIEA